MNFFTRITAHRSVLARVAAGFLLGALTLASYAQAEDFRVGFVNTDRIFREANSAKSAQAKLEQEFAKREKELTDVGNTLKTNSEKFTSQFIDFLLQKQHVIEGEIDDAE